MKEAGLEAKICEVLTFLQDYLHHDPVSGLHWPTRPTSRPAAVDCTSGPVSGTKSGLACSRAEGPRFTEPGHGSTQAPPTQCGPHHQSQEPLPDLLQKHRSWFRYWRARGGVPADRAAENFRTGSASPKPDPEGNLTLNVCRASL